MPRQLDLYDEYFSDTRFDTVTLDDIDDTSVMTTVDDPEGWAFVRARTMTRGSMLYNEGLYKVISTKKDKPLADQLKRTGEGEAVAGGKVKAPSEDAVLKAMPRQEKQNNVVPSIRGEYVTLKEVTGREQSDGTIEVDTTAGFSDTIPVEFVIDVLSYDEAVVELIDGSF